MHGDEVWLILPEFFTGFMGIRLFCGERGFFDALHHFWALRPILHQIHRTLITFF
jgi:hypothetical protein